MKNRNLNHIDHWQTPPYVLDALNKEFHFDCDPCPIYCNLEYWNGLTSEWGKRNYVNPPYSINLKTQFVEKGIEWMKEGKQSLFMLPVSTSTSLFHNLIIPNANEIWFIKGRIQYIGENDKGQLINHHLFGEDVDNKEMVIHDGIGIPKYIRNSGMHDSMLVHFNYIRERTQWPIINTIKFSQNKITKL